MKEKTQTINRSLKILIVTLLMGTMPVHAVNSTGAHTLALIGAKTPQTFVEKTFPDKKISVANDCSVKDKTCGVAAESGPVAHLKHHSSATQNLQLKTRNFFRDGNGSRMDILTYNYQPGTNKLTHVDDDPAIPSGNYGTDLEDQTPGNYNYDAIGNLIEDDSSHIDTILWTTYGKVKEVRKTNGDKIAFKYDASGNRVMKTVTPNGGTATISYYVRDAGGNTMSIYESAKSGTTTTYKQKEVPIYGSDRLGIFKPGAMDTGQASGLYSRKINKKGMS